MIAAFFLDGGRGTGHANDHASRRAQGKGISDPVRGKAGDGMAAGESVIGTANSNYQSAEAANTALWS
jgi:hypothetical protein